MRISQSGPVRCLTWGRAHAFETDRGDQLTDAREACAHTVRQRTRFRVRRFVESLDGHAMFRQCIAYLLCVPQRKAPREMGCTN